MADKLTASEAFGKMIERLEAMMPQGWVIEGYNIFNGIHVVALYYRTTSADLTARGSGDTPEKAMEAAIISAGFVQTN